MKLIYATPLLAKLTLSSPFVPPPAVPVVVNEISQNEVNTDSGCSDVWSRTCTGTNSNGDYIYGSWTCGERVQYVHDYKLGRTPTMSAAIAQILSECPTQCQELAANQCDDFVENNLETVSESECSATWDATCSGVNSAGRSIYGSWTCGERVKYVNGQQRTLENQMWSTLSVFYQCRDQCEHIHKGQCSAFVEGKLNENAVENVVDDYEPIVAEAPVPLGTCQEAYDRTCTDRYGSFTCGKRVEYNVERWGRTIADAIAKVNSECPTECREFQNNNCDNFISANVVVLPPTEDPSEYGSGY